MLESSNTLCAVEDRAVFSAAWLMVVAPTVGSNVNDDGLYVRSSVYPLDRLKQGRFLISSTGAVIAAPEIGALIESSEKVCELGSRKSPALAIVRTRAASQVTDSLVARVRLELTTSAL